MSNERLPVRGVPDLAAWGPIVNKWANLEHNADGTHRAGASDVTYGLADLSAPTVLPTADLGFYECGGSYCYVNESMYSVLKALETSPAVDGIPAGRTTRAPLYSTTYNTFMESHDDGQTSSNGDPAFDTDSDISVSAMCVHSVNQMLGDIWLKHSGSTIVDGFGAQIPNLSDRNYQLYSGIQLRHRCARLGIRALRFDTVNTHITDLGGIGYFPDGITSEAQWENEYLMPYVRNVFPMLRAAGIKVWVNGGAWSGDYHEEGSQNRGDSELRYINMMHPYVDGFMHENAMQGADTIPYDDSIFVSGVAANSYKSWGRHWIRVPQLISALGKGYIQFVYNYNAGQSYRTSRALMLMGWGGDTPFATLCTANDWLTADKWIHGRPIEWPYRNPGGAYILRRKFMYGTVVWNGDPTTAHSAGDAGATNVPARDAKFFPGEWF